MRTDRPSPTDSTPTARENANSLMGGILVTTLIVLWLLPADARFGLLLGLVLAAIFGYALWMRVEENRRRPAPPADATHGRGNPVLADALAYYAERRTLANAKGWDHVLRVVDRAAAGNFWPDATDEQIEDAREVLRNLDRSDKGLLFIED